MIEWEGRVSGHGSPEIISLGGGIGSTGLTYVFPLATLVAIQAVSFKLVTSGAAANRTAVVTVTDGLGAVVYAVSAPAVQTATTTVQYSFGNLVPSFGTLALGFMGGPFPQGKLPENLTLTVSFTNGVAGDLVTNGRLIVRQWPTRHDYWRPSLSDQ